MRHPLIPLVAVASLFSLSAVADDAPLSDWNSQGGYAGISGGFAWGSSNSDSSDLNSRRLRYRDEAPVDTGWQGTLEGGAVLPLGRKVDWLRLRVGGELGYGQYDLDTYRDSFSGDTVSGDFSLLRVGPAAAVDFRLPKTPWSFTAGVGAGVGVVDLNSTVTNGGTSRGGDNRTTVYVSGLIAANYALTPTLDLSLGLRSIWLANARINGTATTVGGTSYSVRHEIQPVSAVELGLRWKF